MSDAGGHETGAPRREPLTIDLSPDRPEPEAARDHAPEAETAAPAQDYTLAAAAAGVGGVSGLAMALVLAGLGLWPGGRTDARAQLEAERGRVSALTARVDEAVTRLDALKAEAGKPVAATPAPADPRIPALEVRVVKLEALSAAVEAATRAAADQGKRLDALAKAPSAPASVPAAAPAPDLTGRLSALETRLAALPQAQPAPVKDESGLGDQLRTLEHRVTEIADLVPRLDALTGRLDKADAAVQALQPLAAETGALKAAGVQGRAALDDLDKRLADLNARLIQITGRMATSASARNDAVLALALADLKSAIDEGRPYAYELEVASRVASAADFSALSGFAAKGVTTLPALRAEFEPLARRILDRETAGAAGGGVFGRLVANARQSIDLQRVGDEAGDTVPARLGRIGKALSAGQSAAALAEWKALPEEARALDSGYGQALAARAQVDDLIRTASRNAMNKLAGRAE